MGFRLDANRKSLKILAVPRNNRGSVLACPGLVAAGSGLVPAGPARDAIDYSHMVMHGLRIDQMARKKISTTVYITPEQNELLKLLHEKTKVPVAEYIRQGIDLVLERERDRLPGQLSLDVVRK